MERGDLAHLIAQIAQIAMGLETFVYAFLQAYSLKFFLFHISSMIYKHLRKTKPGRSMW